MTEHKKIPLPKDGKDGGTESSLFERASGAFGFDPFKAAPIKGWVELQSVASQSVTKSRPVS